MSEQSPVYQPDGAASTQVFADTIDARVKDAFEGGAYGPPENQAYQAYAAQVDKRKSGLVAGYLAIFLGMFGLHKFYLGYNDAGFIMLAFSIVGSLFSLCMTAMLIWAIALVEGVIYISKSQADFERIYVRGFRDWF